METEEASSKIGSKILEIGTLCFDKCVKTPGGKLTTKEEECNRKTFCKNNMP